MANPPYSVLYTAKEIPGKGRGLVAKRNLEPGTLLFEDTGLFKPASPWKMDEIKNPDLYRILLILDDRAHFYGSSWALAFLSLHNAFPERRELRELGVYRTNRVPTRNGKENVFRTVSLLNHSCAPNACYSSTPSGWNAFVYIIKPVAAGEEITRSYTATVGSKRTQELKETFNFDCICSVCKTALNESVGPMPTNCVTNSKDDSDRDLFETVSGLIVETKKLELPLQTLLLAGLGGTLLERLGIVDDRFTQMIEEAFQVTASQRDMQRAKLFAEWILRQHKICFGEHSLEVERANRMLECPEEFAGRYVSKNWETPENDRPRLDTAFEHHMWLWRIDFRHDIVLMRQLPLLAKIIPSAQYELAKFSPSRNNLTMNEKLSVETFRP
ncbi:hypothetical protein BKA65DRAFT_101218 [Rhexocercosporidium sp. MPI-PUGE-AT-0058]|nr:hypothetical protein BKA65DRAFT_101218 [Rhexocercosporidium sp. MPI-PUGE-AT-0058]